jgi:hypothetical protein
MNQGTVVTEPDHGSANDEPALLLRHCQLGATTGADDRYHPTLKPDGAVLLAPDEQVLWQGRAGVSEYRYSEGMDRHDVRWTLPTPADILVTDRRLAYTCRKWDIGTTEPAVTLRHMVDRARAARRRRGIVATGQVRWQWPSRLYVKRGILLIVLGAYRMKGLPALVLSGCQADPQQVANTIRAAVARYRLARTGALAIEAAEANALRERIAAPVFSTGLSQASNLPGPLLFGYLTAEEYQQPDAARLARPPR